MKTNLIVLIALALGVALGTGVGGSAALAQDKEKPGVLDFSKYSKPDKSQFTAQKLYYITPRGGFALTINGGNAVYEFSGVGYDTKWDFIGQNDGWFIFKEQGYNFYMAFARTASGQEFEVRWSPVLSGSGNHYAFAKVYQVN